MMRKIQIFEINIHSVQLSYNCGNLGKIIFPVWHTFAVKIQCNIRPIYILCCRQDLYVRRKEKDLCIFFELLSISLEVILYATNTYRLQQKVRFFCYVFP